jgi:hypothetical protein
MMILREALISRDLFIIDETRLVTIDTEDSLRQYFDLFGSDFMDKVPSQVKLNRQDKVQLLKEIDTFEKYITKRNKNILNIVYLSFKFPQLCELYFRVDPPADG